MNNGPNFGRRDFIKLAGGGFGIAALSYYLGLTDRSQFIHPSRGLPEYQDHNLGFPSFRGPYFQKEVNLAAFLFQADLGRLTELCDQSLNAPEPGSYKYIPLMSNVIMVYADMLVASLDERDARIGFIPETEVSFWVLTLAMQKTSNGYIPNHLAWHLPYLLVDESNAIATGREVYGFNKLAAQFVKPGDILLPEFSSDVLGIREFAPDSQAQRERLVELVQLPAQSAQAAWNDWSAARQDFSRLLIGSLRPDLNAGLVEFAARALIDAIPLVFLKQFRNASDTKRASYRSLVEVPLRLVEYRAGALFSGQFRLKIHPLDSHPLAERLGLKEEQESRSSAWIKVDFILENGIEFD